MPLNNTFCPTGVPDHSNLRRIDIALNGANQSEARQVAEKKASEEAGEVMLLAWYDGKAKTGHPDVPECTGKPAWFAYGTGHGANLMVAVNDDEWVFLFLPLEQN